MIAEERLLSILWSQQEFYNTDDGLSYTLDTYHYREGSYSEDPLTIIKYCFLDIDGNGQKELIVELTDGTDGSICVLHTATDQIYAYNFPSDGFKNLKGDGTFSFCRAEDSGYARLSFSDNACEEQILGYSVSSYDSIPDSYFIDEQPVNKADYMMFCLTQDKKADAEWTEFVPLCKEGLFFFRYSSGHAWVGMEYYSIYPVEAGAMLQYQWIPSGMNENEAPIIQQVVLTEEELDDFSDLIRRKMQLTEWNGFYHPRLEATDQPYWRTCLLYNGEWYYSGGYDFFPTELSLFTKCANSYLAIDE